MMKIPISVSKQDFCNESAITNVTLGAGINIDRTGLGIATSIDGSAGAS